MPGKVNYEQAKGFLSPSFPGNPERRSIARTLFRDKIGAECDPARHVASTPPIRSRRPRGSTGFSGNVRHGRFERSLSGLTAVGALITGAEIWIEHDRASFGNKMMWLPVVLTPAVRRPGGRHLLPRLAKTALPPVSAVVVINSLQGQYLHLRGIAQRPGGFALARYNVEMGPPTFAPLLFGLVGGMGLLAAILRRER